MNRLYPSIFFAVALSGSGCATLSESECESADWSTIGFEDGSRGRLVTYVGNHRKACADYGVKPDLVGYQRGHAQGLVHFCTSRTGFRQGSAGRSYNGVCPVELEADFLVAYEHGRELHLLRQDVRRLNREKQTSAAELEDVMNRITDLETLLVSKQGSVAERQGWIEELKRQEDARGRLEQLLDDLESNEADAEREYELLSERYQY